MLLIPIIFKTLKMLWIFFFFLSLFFLKESALLGQIQSLKNLIYDLSKAIKNVVCNYYFDEQTNRKQYF